MKQVTIASSDYVVCFHHLAIVSNIFMRNGTYPLMFIGRVYNTLINQPITIEYSKILG